MSFFHIGDVMSINILKFSDYFERIYFIELEITETIDTNEWFSYFYLHLETDKVGVLYQIRNITVIVHSFNVFII